MEILHFPKSNVNLHMMSFGCITFGNLPRPHKVVWDMSKLKLSN